ncbi:hypothetical protein ES288_D05G341000v1 [Gossypium darwinii]|uniref:Uncharacterized protein n=1 Tax=Gossypium darwinii TaxID=34276 RepID=A0A5D2CRS2_GOSDA|nr:hypothetical protein ES288_D05G341000v1 [Gossypium darwinii]
MSRHSRGENPLLCFAQCPSECFPFSSGSLAQGGDFRRRDHIDILTVLFLGTSGESIYDGKFPDSCSRFDNETAQRL